MKWRVRLRDVTKALWIALAAGFLASFFAVVVTVVREIDDPTVTTLSMDQIFLVWAAATVAFGVISLLWLVMRGAQQP